MGVYEDLEKLNKPSPTPKAIVGSSDAPIMVEIPPQGAIPISPRPQANISSSSDPKPSKELEAKNLAKLVPASSSDTTLPRHHATVIPRHRDTIVSRHHEATIEIIRKAVKEFGKEAATHRFTPDEKEAMAGIIYTYKTHGLKTSENEIARIAINFILQDYRDGGENSVLARVLKALNE